MTTRNVVDLPANDRAALENLLGGPLSTDQTVFILATASGAAPDEATRSAARVRLQKTLSQTASRAAALGISAEEADAAIDEAMTHIRARKA